MVMAIDELETQVARRQNVQATFGYYRQPNGWITVSPMTQMEELNYRRRGWEPLLRYPRFDMSTEWAANHPLETLFMFGGAHELPVEQVIQMGLYMDPPVVPVCRQPCTQYHKHHVGNPERRTGCWQNAQPVVFPQLAGVTGLGPFDCRFCDRGFPTEQARSQHEGVAHQSEKGEIRTGETLAAALLRGFGGAAVTVQAEGTAVAEVGAPVVPEAMALLLRQMEAMQAELASLRAEKQAPPPGFTAVCEVCGQEFHGAKPAYAQAGLRGHRRAKHREDATAA